MAEANVNYIVSGRLRNVVGVHHRGGVEEVSQARLNFSQDSTENSCSVSTSSDWNPARLGFNIDESEHYLTVALRQDPLIGEDFVYDIFAMGGSAEHRVRPNLLTTRGTKRVSEDNALKSILAEIDDGLPNCATYPPFLLAERVLRGTVGNRFVASLKATNVGTGYSSTPTVEIESVDGNGSGATAEASVGTVTEGVQVELTGESPSFLDVSEGILTYFVDPPARITGSLVRLVLTNPGSGYTATPRVTITGGGGTGASARAILDDNEKRLPFLAAMINEFGKDATEYSQWIDILEDFGITADFVNPIVPQGVYPPNPVQEYSIINFLPKLVPINQTKRRVSRADLESIEDFTEVCNVKNWHIRPEIINKLRIAATYTVGDSDEFEIGLPGRTGRKHSIKTRATSVQQAAALMIIEEDKLYATGAVIKAKSVGNDVIRIGDVVNLGPYQSTRWVNWRPSSIVHTYNQGAWVTEYEFVPARVFGAISDPATAAAVPNILDST